MARPIKDTVNYFPHYSDASSKKTLTILEGRFGVQGYALWFKLLECLASADGHYLDCRLDVEMEFLSVKLRSNPQLASEMLDLLAKLGAIDQELWQKRVIWSENFVKNVADAYDNRKRSVPGKPIITTNNAIITTNLNSNYPLPMVETPVSTPSSTQIILDKNILDNNRVNNSVGEDETSQLQNSKVLKLSPHPFIAKMQLYLGYPETKKEQPIPAIPRESKMIDSIKKRGFTEDDIFECWRQKVDSRNKDFIPMSWVNNDIGNWLKDGKKFINRNNGNKNKIGVEDESDAIEKYEWPN